MTNNTHLSQKHYFRLLTAVSFWLLSSLLHLKFSLFLVEPLDTGFGTITLKDYAPQAGYLLLMLFALYLIWYSIKGSYGNRGLIVWLIWLLLTGIINRYLLATPIENIHFVQYGILSSLLLWGLNTGGNTHRLLIPRVLFWSTLAGIIDEVLQYFWITASYSDYMDFNDFLLNMMGAIAGILFYTGFAPLQTITLKTGTISLRQIITSFEAKTVFLLCLIVSLFYSLGMFQWTDMERKPGSFGSWQPNFAQGEFYVLSPSEGGLLLLVLFAGFILFNSLLHPRVQN